MVFPEKASKANKLMGADLVRPWQMPLFDYIGPHRIEDRALPSPEVVSRVWSAVEEQARRVPESDWTPHPHRADLSYARSGSRLFLRLTGSGRIVAGDGSWFPVVAPGATGQGHGAELRYLKDVLGIDRRTIAYSESGLRAAVSAHRRILERASADGLDIPATVMADYICGPDGALRLRAPYDAARHVANIVAHRRLRFDVLWDSISRDHAAPVVDATELGAHYAELAGLGGLHAVLGASAALGARLHIACRGKALAQVWGEKDGIHFSAFGVAGHAIPDVQPDRFLSAENLDAERAASIRCAGDPDVRIHSLDGIDNLKDWAGGERCPLSLFWRGPLEAFDAVPDLSGFPRELADRLMREVERHLVAPPMI